MENGHAFGWVAAFYVDKKTEEVNPLSSLRSH